MFEFKKGRKQFPLLLLLIEYEPTAAILKGGVDSKLGSVYPPSYPSNFMQTCWCIGE